ncbi:myosin-2 heavy chain-like [Scomber scombrus]|uniref:Myosin-2 heavy chain-like n=1 Tax=Scomber scombrus TaxID=13677 RepID=A0AAV1PS80_SCOSC
MSKKTEKSTMEKNGGQRKPPASKNFSKFDLMNDEFLLDMNTASVKKYIAVVELNGSLKKQLEELRHTVKEFEGQKRATDKRLSIQEEQIKKKDKDYTQIKTEVMELRNDAKLHHALKEDMRQLSDRFSNEQIIKENLLNDIKNYIKQMYTKDKEMYYRDKHIHHLQMNNEEYIEEKRQLLRNISSLEQDEQTLKDKIQTLKTELEDQNILMKHLRQYMDKLSSKSTHLQERLTLSTSLINNRDQEITKTRLLTVEIENHARQQKRLNEEVMGQIELVDEKLLKANSEITDNNKRNQELYNEIRHKDSNINKTTYELKSIERKYASSLKETGLLKNQLQGEKLSHEDSVSTANRDQVRLQKELDKLTEQKNTLDKELFCAQQELLQQQREINQHRETVMKQGQELKHCYLEADLANLEISAKNREIHFNNWNITNLLRQIAELNFKHNNPESRVDCHERFPRKTDAQLRKTIERMEAQVKEKEQNISELEGKLALLPHDAIEKLQQTKWDLGKYQKKLGAAQGLANVYESHYKIAEEEKNRALDDKRKLELESRNSRYNRLPPISFRKSQTSIENKRDDRWESERISRHKHFGLLQYSAHSEDASGILPKPPLKVHGTEIRPYPPKPHK